MKFCIACNKYTLEEMCSCGAQAINPHPPKYSPDDKYANYRRKYKETHTTPQKN